MNEQVPSRHQTDLEVFFVEFHSSPEVSIPGTDQKDHRLWV